jgi:membrane-bound ClpP family serine protease
MPNWLEVLSEVQKYALDNPPNARNSINEIRKKYLLELQQHTGRNVIAYYSGFLSKPPVMGIEITDEDKNGFMMAIHKLDRNLGLDLILHTPGGHISATQSLVDYLHKMFGDNIRSIVPQIAMSAGTMIACSTKEIYMAKHSNLGPIDPQLLGIPAYGVIEEFKRACAEVKADPSKISMWGQIIGKYNPTFLSECENAIARSNQFVTNQLETVMFKGDKQAKVKAKKIVSRLTDYKKNKGHDRHIPADECVEMGLNVKKIEDDDTLQDLVLTVHHCYMHTLMNTNCFKIIENHNGICFSKNAQLGMM